MPFQDDGAMAIEFDRKEQCWQWETMSFAQERSCHIVADERLFVQLRIQSSGRLHLRRGARLSTKKRKCDRG